MDENYIMKGNTMTDRDLILGIIGMLAAFAAGFLVGEAQTQKRAEAERQAMLDNAATMSEHISGLRKEIAVMRYYDALSMTSGDTDNLAGTDIERQFKLAVNP